MGVETLAAKQGSHRFRGDAPDGRVVVFVEGLFHG